MEHSNMLICGILILLIIYICMSKKENFVGYSSYRSTGRKNKEICNNYYLKHYLECINRSGGRDVQGNCWNRIKPHLFACNYNDF